MPVRGSQITDTGIIKKQANRTLVDSYNTIIAHAQDYVMATIAMKDLAVEIVHLYAKIENMK